MGSLGFHRSSASVGIDISHLLVEINSKMFEPDFVDEERVPLIDRYENNDDSVYEDSQAETSFSDMQQEATEAELRSRERHLEKKTGRSTPWRADSMSEYHPKSESDSGFLAGTSRLKNLQGNS